MANIRFKLVGYAAKVYWRIFKPFSVGVRALVVDAEGRILLVKHTYSNGWYLPGCGAGKKEHLQDALSRELHEEIGLSVTGSVELLGTYSNFFESKSDFVSVFVVRSFTLSPAGNEEIAEWKFFDQDEIPENASTGTRKRIQEYLGRKAIDFKW